MIFPNVLPHIYTKFDQLQHYLTSTPNSVGVNAISIQVIDKRSANLGVAFSILVITDQRLQFRHCSEVLTATLRVGRADEDYMKSMRAMFSHAPIQRPKIRLGKRRPGLIQVDRGAIPSIRVTFGLPRMMHYALRSSSRISNFRFR